MKMKGGHTLSDTTNDKLVERGVVALVDFYPAGVSLKFRNILGIEVGAGGADASFDVLNGFDHVTL